MENSDTEPEADSRWIAYELHDGLLQWVVSARMNVDSALGLLNSSQEPTDVVVAGEKSRLTSACQALAAALAEGRELIQFLENQSGVPNVDFGTGLVSYVEAATLTAASCGQTIQVECNIQDWSELDQCRAWNLLRICRQAIANAMHHAGPCEIRLRCERSEDSLRISVSDNGTGFDPKETIGKPNHFGIAAMKHRAKLLGTSLIVESKIGRGTTISVAVPVG